MSTQCPPKFRHRHRGTVTGDVKTVGSDYWPSSAMNPFLTLPHFHHHKRLLYISLALFILLCLLWTGPDIRTSTQQWLAHTSTATSDTTVPYTAAIIYLVRLSSESQLLESLESVYRYLPGHPWPVILFHTGDFDEESPRTNLIGHLHDLIGVGNASRAFSDRIEFVKLDWQLPKGISSDKNIVDPVDAHRWPGMLTPYFYVMPSDC
jgi:mannosyltransferase